MIAQVSLEKKQLLLGIDRSQASVRLTRLLQQEGYAAAVCPDALGFFERLEEWAGVVIVTDGLLAALAASVGEGRDWPDVPVILLTHRRSNTRAELQALRRTLPGNIGDLTILEEPVGLGTLLSTVAIVWQSRQRQWELRSRLDELDEQRATFERLVEHLPVAVCLIDTKGATVLSNANYERYVPNRMIPSVDSDRASRWAGGDSFGRPITRDQFPAARALRGELVSNAEFRFLPENGDPVWTRISAVPLYDSSAKVKGAALMIIDVSAEKQNEAMLRQFNVELEQQVSARTQELEEALDKLTVESHERARAEEQLRQSMKMDAVGQLTGGIAHDFNNMLTGIIGALDLMRLRIGREEYRGLERYMDAAHSSASRAAALTQRLLAFSRRQSLEPRVIEVNTLIGSLSELLTHSLNERIELRIQLGDDAGLAQVDPNQLESALLNLSINARDAMPDGGRLTLSTRRVEIDSARAATLGGTSGTFIAISVIDTGVGIPDALLTQIFEPFFTTKPLGQGTGLGLSMVYGFVQQSGGFVTVSSQVGKGTGITLHIPPAAERQETDVTRPALDSLTPGRGQTIFVVEDDDAVRLLLETALQDLGYEVHLAENGQDALARLSAMERIDLLVTDVGLPGLNGRQLAEMVQQRWPALPVLFISGYAENAAIRTEFLGPGMRMMIKPFTLEHLALTVSEALHGEVSAHSKR
ncbi:response regulator [Stutzerimonas marianensis]|uniref:response regulator n=1 Tax=Stutzerimonas marianensis TaxID=2929513 RepID=UPI003C2C55CD